MTTTTARDRERIEALQTLVDRLCASDLTLDESKALCARLSEVLSTAEACGPAGVAAASPGGGTGAPMAATC